MKKGILFLATALISSCLFGQVSIRQSNWQQRCDYYLDVSLNDIEHSLTGTGRYVYTNNSPDALDTLIFHIWPNAYKDDQTDFARQQLLNGSKKFHFADDSLRGYISKLDFQVNGQQVDWSYFGDQIDIAVLPLKERIKPGQTVEITTPFYVKIPGSFSRFGHQGQGYQMTQWYPKPAVYDVNGWNQMPYLDQGEFYSEFGKFTVNVTVPDNYVVAATGELQTASENQFLIDRMNNPVSKNDEITSSSTTKTLTYVQDNIHDFAWFADKHFNVKQDEVKLNDGSVVKTWVYATQKNLDYTDDIALALKYYSEHCGIYPYKHCTVVKGALKAGGGMEYPMITVVTSLNKEVIVHEVGHNWFYGILGTDERRYPWMDESINSYFEHETIHGSDTAEDVSLDPPTIRTLMKSGLNSGLMRLGYEQIEVTELHQAIGEHSKLLTGANYGMMVYGKGADAFGYLRDYLGQETFDECFQAYYFKWKFKHPLPGDMKDVFEKVSGKNLRWFFDELIATENHLDMAVMDVTAENITLSNFGGVSGPVPLGLFKHGELVKTIWVEGFEGDTVLSIRPGDADLVKLDPREITLDYKRSNNTMRVKGIARGVEPLRIRYMNFLHDPNANSLNVLPLLGYNIHNKLMLGASFNNITAPRERFGFNTTALYGFGTKDINGIANISYIFPRNKPLMEWGFGVKGMRFAFDNANQSFNKIEPNLVFRFRNKDKRMPQFSRLTLKSTILTYDENYSVDDRLNQLRTDTTGRQTFTRSLTDAFFTVEYLMANNKAINPGQAKLWLEAGMPQQSITRNDTTTGMLVEEVSDDFFVKLNAEWLKKVTYKQKRKSFNTRLFAGVFLDESDRGLYHYRMESAAGKWDYRFSKLLMGRGATEGTFSRQVVSQDVFLKEPGTFSNISQWVVAANFSADVPFKLPLAVYFDAFTFNGMKDLPNVSDGEFFIYNAGLEVEIIPEFFEIYIPMFSSKMIREAQELQGIEDLGQRITFQLNLNLFDDKNMMDLFRGVGG